MHAMLTISACMHAMLTTSTCFALRSSRGGTERAGDAADAQHDGAGGPPGSRSSRCEQNVAWLAQNDTVLALHVLYSGRPQVVVPPALAHACWPATASWGAALRPMPPA